MLAHNRIELALHELRAAPGPRLLLLHGLAERSPDRVPPELSAWPGPVHALDFTGQAVAQLAIPIEKYSDFDNLTSFIGTRINPVTYLIEI